MNMTFTCYAIHSTCVVVLAGQGRVLGDGARGV